MRPLPASELLDHWASGQTQPRWVWAETMVGAAFPELGRAGTDALTVGARDRRLLELREALFGPELACCSTCPTCRETVETAVAAKTLRQPEHPESPPEAIVRAAGCEVHWRLLTTRDLADAAQTREVDRMRDALLERCIVSALRDGAAVARGDLPAAALSRVMEAIAAADPQADIQLELTCPGCGATWTEPFDVVAFLWSEVDAWARRLLRDVHALASAYGWTEPDVLALSARRRAHYLEMIGA